MTRKIQVKFAPRRKPTGDYDWMPSEQQTEIFNWFKDGKGNLVVRARAGTGKTSTIVRAVKFAPERSILLCAFNKKIARELEARLTSPRATAKTLHGVGYALVRANWSVKGTDDERARKLAVSVCGDIPKTILNLVAKLHTKGREMAPFATESGDLMPLAYQFDCVPDEQWEEDGYDAVWIEAKALEAMEIAATVEPVGGIDFADMLYLPVRNRWMRPKYDMVVVDEAQDMNSTQLLIAQGVAKGRIVVVGDDRQAIYSFRGADSESLDRLKGELNAKELGLTQTFRCGKTIVAAAQEIVPDFVAHDSNPEGEIRYLGSGAALAGEVVVGDFVLSRTNAPLVRTALAILRTGTRCKIEGRDIGKGLIALVRRMSKDTTNMVDLLTKLERWRSREVERAEKSGHKGAEAKVERVNDQALTITTLAEDLTSARELCVRIEDLFTTRNGEPQVTCSSIHRAKGLEADRVYVLEDTLMGGAPCDCGHWSGRHRTGSCNGCACKGVFHEDAIRAQEEANIKYVAITRAKQTLVWVHG